MDRLALLGGDPAVTQAHPHNDLVAFDARDREALQAFLDSEESTASYYGREGLLRQFEDELAEFFGVRYCVLTNSGTNALHSAYFGLGLEPGDEVIAPTYTFLATVTPLLQLGVVPVLADCEADTGNIDPEDVARKVTDRTRAIVVTHQWGHPVEMDPIRAIAREHGLKVVEDGSLAFGATYHGRRVGGIGDASAFSLGSTKIVSGGQGGAMLTDDEEIMERANLVGHFVRRSEDQVQSPYYRRFCDTGYGHNYRMHVLAIVMARSRFQRLDERVAGRHERLDRLSEWLDRSGLLRPPVTRPYVHRGQWGGYTATYAPGDEDAPSLDTVVEALQAEGLEVFPRGYHPPLHLTAFFQTEDDGFYPRRRFAENKRIYAEGDLPVAEAHGGSQIAFPIFIDEPLELVDAYGEAVAKVADQLDELAAWERRRVPDAAGEAVA